MTRGGRAQTNIGTKSANGRSMAAKLANLRCTCVRMSVFACARQRLRAPGKSTWMCHAWAARGQL